MDGATGSQVYDVIVVGAGHAGCEAALAAEAKAFAKLARTEQAAGLIGIFHADQFLKKKSKQQSGGARAIKHAAVLGAGIMGGGTLSGGAVTGAVNGVMTTPLLVAAFSGGAVSRGLGLGLALLSVAAGAGLAAGAGAAAGGGSCTVLQGTAHALSIATRATTISSLGLGSIILYTSPWY